MSDNKMAQIADELDKMQTSKNHNTGVSCVKTLIYFLRTNRLDKARAVAYNEWDKISSYKDIAELLIKERIYMK